MAIGHVRLAQGIDCDSLLHLAIREENGIVPGLSIEILEQLMAIGHVRLAQGIDCDYSAAQRRTGRA